MVWKTTKITTDHGSNTESGHTDHDQDIVYAARYHQTYTNRK